MDDNGEQADAVSVPASAGRELASTSTAIAELPYAPGYPKQGDDNRGKLLRYFGIVRKHRWLVISIAALVVAAGTLLTFLTTPVYRSVATLQIDRDAAKIVQVEGVQSVESNDPSFYPTQYELLKSRSLASRVVAELNLTEDIRFLQAAAPSAWSKLRQVILRRLAGGETSSQTDASAEQGAAPGQNSGGSDEASTGGAAERPLGYFHAKWIQLRQSAAAQLASSRGADPEDYGNFARRQGIAIARVLAGLTVQPVGTSRLVRVSFESTDPQVAAQVANAIAENFIQSTLDRRYGASSYARTFLQERLQELKLKLEESERQLVQYAQDEQIVSTTGAAPNGATSSLAQATLAQASTALGEATNERIKAEQVWRQVKATQGLVLPQSTESKAIDVLREKRAQLSAEYQQRLSDYKPAYPDMVKLKAQIDELDRQMQNEVSLIKGAIEMRYTVAVKQEDSLRRYLEALKKEVLEFERRNIQYKILRREVDTNNSLYEGLLQRYKEIGVAGGVGTNNVSIVDPAKIPGGPFKPNRLRNMALALALGLVLGVGAAFGVEFFNDALKLPEDVETELGITVLGITPETVLPNGVLRMLDEPHSALAEAFRSLRTALQFSTEAGAPKSLLVTSPRPAEGKSTVSLALARAFAQIGMRVLLIDADLRDPSLHRELLQTEADGRGANGLTNYLAGSEPPYSKKPSSPDSSFFRSGPCRPTRPSSLPDPNCRACFGPPNRSSTSSSSTAHPSWVWRMRPCLPAPPPQRWSC